MTAPGSRRAQGGTNMSVDEPLLGPDFNLALPSYEPEDPSLVERIERLVEGERYAVLCTQGEGQPYASIVAFVMAEDSTAAAFATAVTTRKYELLKHCDRVALFVDNRSQGQEAMMHIEALTATGRATELGPGEERERWLRRLVLRHPQLESFFQSPTCALFRVDIVRYFHVSRFQEVRQWTPTRDG